MTIKAQTDDLHVDEREAKLAGLETATEPEGSPSWLPTRKWIAGLVTGVASIAASWIVTGGFDDVERGMAATLLVALAGAYFQANDPTPGGVPEA